MCGIIKNDISAPFEPYVAMTEPCIPEGLHSRCSEPSARVGKERAGGSAAGSNPRAAGGTGWDQLGAGAVGRAAGGAEAEARNRTVNLNHNGWLEDSEKNIARGRFKGRSDSRSGGSGSSYTQMQYVVDIV